MHYFITIDSRPSARGVIPRAPRTVHAEVEDLFGSPVLTPYGEALVVTYPFEKDVKRE
jgi:hypothetical protein